MKDTIITVRGPEEVEDCDCPICTYLGIKLSELEPYVPHVRELSEAEAIALNKYHETKDEKFLRRD